jgi:hypothetical protein
MKLIAFAALVGLAFSGLSGCKLLERFDDEELAEYVEKGAYHAANQGIRYLIKENPEKEEDYVNYTQTAIEVVNDTILPVFEGAEVGEVLRSTVDTALAYLSERIEPDVASAIQLAVNVASHHIEMPDNPTDKLSERAHKALIAFFKGLRDGMAAAIAPEEEAGPDGPQEFKFNFKSCPCVNCKCEENEGSCKCPAVIRWPSNCGCDVCECDVCDCE